MNQEKKSFWANQQTETSKLRAKVLVVLVKFKPTIFHFTYQARRFNYPLQKARTERVFGVIEIQFWLAFCFAVRRIVTCCSVVGSRVVSSELESRVFKFYHEKTSIFFCLQYSRFNQVP